MFSHFVTTRGPQFGQGYPKKKSILNTHPISVHQVWNWLFGYVFYIMVGNHHFQSFCGHQRAEIWLMWPKIKSILKTNPISVHIEFELDCFNTFSDNCRKPHFPSLGGNQRAKIWPRWPKSRSFLNNHPICVNHHLANFTSFFCDH